MKKVVFSIIKTYFNISSKLFKEEKMENTNLEKKIKNFKKEIKILKGELIVSQHNTKNYQEKLAIILDIHDNFNEILDIFKKERGE